VDTEQDCAVFTRCIIFPTGPRSMGIFTSQSDIWAGRHRFFSTWSVPLLTAIHAVNDQHTFDSHFWMSSLFS